MVSIYRAPMRSRRDDVPEGAAVERALHLGLVGMGGALPRQPLNIADAVASLSVDQDARLAARVRRFALTPTGSLAWTRDRDGHFWLGRLTGQWRYDDSPDAVVADLVHVRPCHWLSTPTAGHEVPPGVQESFARGGKNWQGIHAAGAHGQSLRIWEHAHG